MPCLSTTRHRTTTTERVNDVHDFHVVLFQLGNGWRVDLRKSVMSSRILGRRLYSASTSLLRPSKSCSYHSSGIRRAKRQTSSTFILSARPSAGSNASSSNPGMGHKVANCKRLAKGMRHGKVEIVIYVMVEIPLT